MEYVLIGNFMAEMTDNMNVPPIFDSVTEIESEEELDNIVGYEEIFGLNVRKKRADAEGFALMIKSVKSNQQKSLQIAQQQKKRSGKKK